MTRLDLVARATFPTPDLGFRARPRSKTSIRAPSGNCLGAGRCKHGPGARKETVRGVQHALLAPFSCQVCVCSLEVKKKDLNSFPRTALLGCQVTGCRNAFHEYLTLARFLMAKPGSIDGRALQRIQ